MKKDIKELLRFIFDMMDEEEQKESLEFIKNYNNMTLMERIEAGYGLPPLKDTDGLEPGITYESFKYT